MLAIVTDSWLWNDPDDSRRGEARRRNQGQTDTELISQAESLRALGLDIRSTVIYAPRPAPSARVAREATVRAVSVRPARLLACAPTHPSAP